MLGRYVETDECPYSCNGHAHGKALERHSDYAITDGRNARVHVGVPGHGLCIEMYMETMADGAPVACSAALYNIGLGLLTVSTPTAGSSHGGREVTGGFMEFFRIVRGLGHRPYKMTITAPGLVERLLSEGRGGRGAAATPDS